ncbi:MAG: hypothetical protein B5M55_04285, partial [Desulfococcus sp. 4484_242]
PAWRRDGVGKDLKYRRTSAPLPPCTCLLQAGARQARRLQDLGDIIRGIFKRFLLKPGAESENCIDKDVIVS